MNTHRQIIELWPTRAAFARELGVDYQLARGWHTRNSIPSDYWVDVVHAAHERGFDQITNDLLAAIKAGERNRAEAAA
jgi:hypothetical protein